MEHRLLAALVLASAAWAQPYLGGCPVFPADHILNTPIDRLPVDRNSDAYIATIGRDVSLHADFGPDPSQGIPFVTVPGTQPKVSVRLQSPESDPGPYPIPQSARVEGGAASNGDRHVLVVDRDKCVLYEMFHAYLMPDGAWEASSGAVFNLLSNALRPDGWTSADAAGLPILAGLVRWEEVRAGEIRHAIRLTVPRTRREYVWPARHRASSLADQIYPPMGQYFRLRAVFPTSDFSPEVQVILHAMQKYGLILADNGKAWFISGAPDPHWSDRVLRELHRVRGQDLEAVDVSSLRVSKDSAQARKP